MPEDKKKDKKPGGKTGEMLLGVLGALGQIAGPLVTGQNVDFGLPFKLGSAYLQNERMNEDLQKALASNPHTADLPGEIEGLMQGGGLPGLLNQLSPQMSISPQVQEPSLVPPLQTGVQVPTPSGITAPQSIPQEPTIPQGEQPNLQSAEFLQRLAEFRPDLAEKIVTSQASQKPGNPIDDVMKMLALQSYQSPQEKAEAKTQRDTELDEMYRTRQMDLAQEKARLGREKWKVGEEKALSDSREAVSALRFTMDQVNSGINQNVLSAVMGKSPVSARVGATMGMYTNEQLQQMREIKKMVMKAVKTQSGVQYGFRELQWIKSAMPSEWDSPEMFRRGVTMLHNTTLWNQYDRIMFKAHKAQNVEVALREGMTKEQVKAYTILKAQLKNRATNSKSELAIFADPQNAKLLEYLDMSLLDSDNVRLKGSK